MSGIIDITKGRIKEAAGVLTGNDDLRKEGKIDQAAGKAKVVVEDTVQKIKDGAKKTIDKLKGTAK